MNILYVENHAVFAESVKRQFLSHHLVTIVPSILVAREALLHGTFELLLVDYDLDDGKGDELVRMVRAAGNGIIIIGASSHEEGNAALMRAGATAICSKAEFDDIEKVIDGIR